MIRLTIATLFIYSFAFAQEFDSLKVTDPVGLLTYDSNRYTDSVYLSNDLFYSSLYTSSGTLYIFGLTKKDTVRRVVDSSLYSGLLHFVSPTQGIMATYTERKINVLEGVPVSEETIDYFKVGIEDSTPVSKSIVSRSLMWGDECVNYYRNGDTNTYFRKVILNGMTINELYTYDDINGSLKKYERSSFSKHCKWKKEYLLNEIGDTTSYTFAEYYSDTCEVNDWLKDSLSVEELKRYKEIYCRDSTKVDYVEFDSRGEEIRNIRFINDKVDGRFVMKIENEAGIYITLVTIWSKGELIDVINDNIVYVSRHNQIISEEKFIEVINERSNYSLYPIAVPLNQIEALGATFIVYTPDMMRKIKTTEQLQFSLLKIFRKRKKQLNKAKK